MKLLNYQNRNLTQEDKLFIQEFIGDVLEELQESYQLRLKEANNLIEKSVFLELMEEDPEYVVNHDVEYWADRIYGAKKRAYQPS